MGKYKLIISELDKKINEDVRISDYFEIFGYAKKWTFERYLKTTNFRTYKKLEKINNRTGKEMYIKAKHVLSLLNEHFVNDEDWKFDYRNYLYLNFKQIVYKFKETSKTKRRENLCIHVSAKGVFYNYSLNSLEFASQVGLCPYDCYKIANTYFNYRDVYTTMDYKNGIPFAYFDSINRSTRSLFLDFIDKSTMQLVKIDVQRIVIEAYRMAIVELLDQQSKIDNKANEADKLLESKNEEELKSCYREACKLFHPDTNKNPEAEEIMKQINNFYEDKNYHGIKNILSKVKRTL